MKRASHERTKRKTIAIAYWLVPAKPERDLFTEIIRILATELDAPIFQPHLTICSAPETARARDALKQITDKPIRLHVAGVRVSDRFTKTLFVRFYRNRALDDLNQKVRRAAKIPPGVLRDPHVSLLYKEMPKAAKRDLAATIRLPFADVTFDAIKVVRFVAPIETAADIKTWQLVATKNLAG